MARTPYELRLELLKLAFDIVNQQRCTEETEAFWEAELKGGQGKAGISLPKHSVGEVITIADELNKFVSKNTSE